MRRMSLLVACLFGVVVLLMEGVMSDRLFEIPEVKLSWVSEAPEGYSRVHDLGAVDGMLFFECDAEWQPVGWVIPVGDHWGYFIHRVYRDGKLGELIRHGLCDTEEDAISGADSM